MLKRSGPLGSTVGVGFDGSPALTAVPPPFRPPTRASQRLVSMALRNIVRVWQAMGMVTLAIVAGLAIGAAFGLGLVALGVFSSPQSGHFPSTVTSRLVDSSVASDGNASLREIIMVNLELDRYPETELVLTQ